MEREAEGITKRIERGEGDTESQLERARFIPENLEHAGWDRREGRIEKVLGGLGFSRDDFAKDAAGFSGGWQMRIAFAKILILSPDILILDEPTNYAGPGRKLPRLWRRPKRLSAGVEDFSSC